MKKITYTTRLNEVLIKRFKIHAIKRGLRQNELLEEAMWDILKKGASNKPVKKKS